MWPGWYVDTTGDLLEDIGGDWVGLGDEHRMCGSSSDEEVNVIKFSARRLAMSSIGSPNGSAINLTLVCSLSSAQSQSENWVRSLTGEDILEELLLSVGELLRDLEAVINAMRSRRWTSVSA
jgi:hypothetical protein